MENKTEFSEENVLFNFTVCISKRVSPRKDKCADNLRGDTVEAKVEDSFHQV